MLRPSLQRCRPGNPLPRDRLVHAGDGVRILRADIDVALGCAHGQCRDRHALNQHERIALHRHAVREGARVALIRIAHHILLWPLSKTHRLPLDTGRKGGPTTPAQTRIRYLFDDCGGGERSSAPQTGEAIQSFVVGDGQRVVYPHARERQPLLRGQIRDRLNGTLAQCVGCALQKTCIQQSRHVIGRHWAVGDAAAGRCNFNEGFQPQQASRSVAHHVER